MGLATLAAMWRCPKLGFLGACIFAILAPTMSIVPVTTQVMALHRMYLPLAVVATAVVLGCYAALKALAQRKWISRGSERSPWAEGS